MDVGTFLGARLRDAELAEALGSAVKRRTTLHVWPLTSTERVVLADGRCFAYKAQVAPSVEADFYASVTSSLLVESIQLGSRGGTSHLATVWSDAPTLRDWAIGVRDPARVATYIERVSAEINRVDASAPVVVDLSANRWEAVIEDTLSALTAHIDSGRYARVDGRAVAWLEHWSASSPVRQLLDREPVVVHGDLTPDEVFVTSAGPRVIDWQRPVLGPADLDQVSLCRGLGLDPARSLPQVLTQMERFVLLHWGVTVARDHLPDRARATEPWVELALRTIAPNAPMAHG